MMHPNDAERTIEAWRVSLKEGTPYRTECRLWDRKINGYAWYLGTAVPVRNDLGQIVRWIGTCTEIDEQKRTEGGRVGRSKALPMPPPTTYKNRRAIWPSTRSF